MKLYTTSQEIRILERYPNRGYVFEVGTSLASMRISVPEPGPHAVFESKLRGDQRFTQCRVLFRSDWRLVRPKRKRGRSIALSGEAIGVVSWQSKHADHYRSLPPGTWTLIAVEKTDG